MQPIFAPAEPLPRGPHQLSREEVARSQRMRLMAAFTELLARVGFAAVTIGELTRTAAVSRAAFYEHFADKQECLFAAYDHFASTLIGAMTADLADDMPWDSFIDSTLAGYLGTLEDDPIAARAFLVEMDGAGPAARARRDVAIRAFAALLQTRHAEIRARDPSLGPLPERVHRGLVLGIRELAREALEEEQAPKLTSLAPDIVLWITAAIEGAEAARRHKRSLAKASMVDNEPVLDRLVRRLYERLGRRYKLVFLATQIPTSLVVALSVVAMLFAFYDPSWGDAGLIAASASLFTALGVGLAITRQRDALAEMAEWVMKADPSAADTATAWDAAVNLPMRSFRRNSLTTNAIAALPSVAVMVIVLDLPISAYPVVLIAGAIAAAYGTILTFSIAEALVRPAVIDMAAVLPEDFDFQGNGLPLRKRLLISLPVFTIASGLVVASLVSDGGGTHELLVSVAASIGAGLALSLELTVLLGRAITSPIARLRTALARVNEGDYSVRVPVHSSDDLGDLSHAFNLMASGLAEREQIREAFGTYLDKDVAGFILSGQFPEGGVEVDVSIMFCDVPAFTPFAERLSATEVISSLNELFEMLVPIIDRHGGHVDKFMGDGLLAVFGAPENFADHADRALAAGLDIVRAVRGRDEGLSVRVGINSGRVVAGSIGGAGRLNFSVIGDAVNVAARVEAATRDTGDELLITCDTRDALTRPAELVSRGSIPLKGKSEPMELFAAANGVPPAAATGGRDVYA